MKIINATPHPIAVIKGNETITFEKTELLARVSVVEKEIEPLDGFSCVSQEFGEIEGLPSEQDGVFYIVSAMVLGANKTRKDLIAPNTGKSAIRNEKGHIVAVAGFVK